VPVGPWRHEGSYLQETLSLSALRGASFWTQWAGAPHILRPRLPAKPSGGAQDGRSRVLAGQARPRATESVRGF
jgi:hypothetical protein